MNTESWTKTTQHWRDIYTEHTARAQKTWLDSQSQLATALAGSAASDASGDATTLAQLWRSWTTFGDSLWRSAPGMVGAMPGGAALGALPDSLTLSVVGGGAVDDALRRMTEGPRLADVGACERLVATVTQRWLSVQRSARESESVLAAAWAQANTRFVEKLTTRAGTRTDIPDAKATLELWLETANEVALETHRSPKFLDAQRQLLRSGMDFMLAERALVEAFAEPAGLPTRTEIDEIHRSVHDLKRRVKALERAAQATSTNRASTLAPDHDPVPGEEKDQ